MGRILRGLFLTTAGLAVAACSGGATTSNPFLLESDVAGVAGSGLTFADASSGEPLLNLAPGDNFNVRLLRYENLQGSDDADLVFSTETVTLVEDGPSEYVADITFAGETVRFVFDNEDFLDATGMLASGQEVFLFPAAVGGFSIAYEIYSYTYLELDPVDGALNSEGNFVAGFETNPTTIAARTGTATFDGPFEGFGATIPADGSGIQNEREVLGEITFEVFFDTDTLDADLEGQADIGRGQAFTGSMTGAPITQNGFQGDLDITCAGSVTCTSDSEIGGAFFGPDGTEITGLIALDITGTDTETSETARFVSSAGFVASEILE